MSGQPPAGPPKILIVDDSPAFLQLTRKTLQGAGYAVVTAPRAAEGIREARRAAPHLILLDIEMPDMDGLTACATIRADPILRHIPIIMLTATDDAKLNERAFQAGAMATILKGTNTPSFLNTVRLALRSKGKSGG